MFVQKTNICNSPTSCCLLLEHMVRERLGKRQCLIDIGTILSWIIKENYNKKDDSRCEEINAIEMFFYIRVQICQILK